MFENFFLFIHTIKYLKPIQVFYWFFFKIYRPRLKFRRIFNQRSRSNRLGFFLLKKQSYFPPNRFTFLNHSGILLNQKSWNDSTEGKLWVYNLHYFNDLNADNAHQRKIDHEQLIDRWVLDNPPGKGNGWESYPTSLRIVNWIKWTLKGNRLTDTQLESLFMQTEWLSKRLEFHLLGNHLIANAKAMIFSGVFFGCGKAKRWLALGINVLDNQLKEQILCDGGHFERSPMYHAIVLEDILDLIQMAMLFNNVISKAKVTKWREVAKKMLYAMRCMTHTDGKIAFFNDAAFNIAPEIEELCFYANQMGIAPENFNNRIQYLNATGYISISRGNSNLIMDVGSIGPDYLPAHAHADSLSFELSIKGQRVFVNSGTSCYGKSKERLRQRKTAAHNCLSVNKADSSEVWSSFRVGRRAKIQNVKMKIHGKVDQIEAAHDGYKRLKSVGNHVRKWKYSNKQLQIIDKVYGRGVHLINIYFHLHPLIDIQPENDRIYLFDKTDELLGILKLDSALDFFIENGEYHPGFGISESAKLIVVSKIVSLPFKCLNKIEFA